MAESLPDESPATETELLQSGFRYALSLCHHVEDAEDLVQQAWLNLCRASGRVESRALLFTAVRNLFIDQFRRRKVVQFDEWDDAAGADIPAALGEEPGVKGDLETLLASLKPGEREVLFLHYHQGYTAEEVGQLTSQPRNTVLSIAHRAIAKLREFGNSKTVTKIRNQITLLFVTFL